jgi:hypothetical protein
MEFVDSEQKGANGGRQKSGSFRHTFPHKHKQEMQKARLKLGFRQSVRHATFTPKGNESCERRGVLWNA